MKKLPPDLLTFGIAYLLVALLFGGAWYWSYTQRTAHEQELEAVSGQLQASLGKKISPTRGNLQTVRDNLSAASTLWNETLPALAQSRKLFEPVESVDADGKAVSKLSPEEWKRELNTKRFALNQLAESKKVNTPNDFYYGFSFYKAANPTPEQTHLLGIQLLVAEELSKIMVESGVMEILAVRRSSGEARPVSRTDGAGEMLGATIQEGPDGLYQIHPFEIEFTGTTSALRSVVNRLCTSGFLLIPRFVQVENSANRMPSLSELATQAGKGSGEVKKIFYVVAGQEKCRAKIRVDLVYWMGPGGPQTPKRGGA
jgi:hypothetical protein